ncbi:histone H3-like centromeric protein cse-4 [Xylariaceae sp. FL0662B]|nr:histone H3-like centromeric protein cse-4 [Xylariaceae sp. FL0662B]
MGETLSLPPLPRRANSTGCQTPKRRVIVPAKKSYLLSGRELRLRGRSNSKKSDRRAPARGNKRPKGGRGYKSDYFMIISPLTEIVHALKEIRQYQKTTELLFPKLSFQRIIREVIKTQVGRPYRMEKAAIEAVQEAAESFLVTLFESSNLCTIHAKRHTLQVQDMRLVREIYKG